MVDKMTNRKALTFAIEAIGDSNPEATAKLQKMIEQIDKKNASPKKLTAQQEKNETLKEVIVEFLAEKKPNGYTVSDLIKEIPEFEGDSNQHVSALTSQLVKDGKIERYTEKRRTYFRAKG